MDKDELDLFEKCKKLEQPDSKGLEYLNQLFAVLKKEGYKIYIILRCVKDFQTKYLRIYHLSPKLAWDYDIHRWRESLSPEMFLGDNHKKNMKKRMNKKNKVSNAPPAYEAEHNINVICPSIDDEGPPRYS